LVEIIYSDLPMHCRRKQTRICTDLYLKGQGEHLESSSILTKPPLVMTITHFIQRITLRTQLSSVRFNERLRVATEIILNIITA